MKFYQCRNLRKFYYTLFFSYIFVFGISSIGAFLSSETGIGIVFLILALSGAAAFIYTQVTQVFKRTVELTEEKIIYKDKYKTVELKWEDIERAFLYYRFLTSYQRIIFFVAYDCSINDVKNMKNNCSTLHTEYNDELLDLVRKYWDGAIDGEEMYLKYKRKKAKRFKALKNLFE